MMESLTDLSVEAFTTELAAKTSVPGGGGAAALCGALGAALCSMSANFTTGKKKYAAFEADYERILQETDRVRFELLACMDEDAEAFLPLSRAYGIPKDDPTREEVLEKATLDACRVPEKMVHLCCESVELLEEMEQKGSVLLQSDVACAALMTAAALQSAALNVFVNTKTLKDQTTAEDIETRVDGALSVYVPRAKAVADRIEKKMRTK